MKVRAAMRIYNQDNLSLSQNLIWTYPVDRNEAAKSSTPGVQTETDVGHQRKGVEGK